MNVQRHIYVLACNRGGVAVLCVCIGEERESGSRELQQFVCLNPIFQAVQDAYVTKNEEASFQRLEVKMMLVIAFAASCVTVLVK